MSNYADSYQAAIGNYDIAWMYPQDFVSVSAKHAHKATGGSTKALPVSLLTSNAIFYRRKDDLSVATSS